MIEGIAGVQHSLNNFGSDAHVIRMENHPHEFIYINRVEGEIIFFNSRQGFEDAMVFRDFDAAVRFIEQHNLVGYKPIRLQDIHPTDASMN